MSSLEYAVEEFVRLLMVADSRLAAINIHHHGKDGAGVIESITLKGEKGAEHIAGIGTPQSPAFEVAVKATFSTGVLDLAGADAVAAAQVESVCKSALSQGTIDALGPTVGLSYLALEPETEMNRSDGSKVRKRIITFPFIAKAA